MDYAVGAGARQGGRLGSKEGCSFLKKRTKKLPSVWPGLGCQAGRKRMKVFLLLFLQKKKILAC
jgi:hypothetical protein